MAEKANRKYVENAFLLYVQDKEGHAFKNFLTKMKSRVSDSFEIKSIPTHFLGQWDAVSAINHFGCGRFKEKSLAMIHVREQYNLLPEWIANCSHAVAIHELRPIFEPLLWQGKTEGAVQNLNQVWFAGGHSDIGGGYATSDLDTTELNKDCTGTVFSDICLQWMRLEAEEYGFLTKSQPQTTACEFPIKWPHQEYDGKLPFQNFSVRSQLLATNTGDRNFGYVHKTACNRLQNTYENYREKNATEKKLFCYWLCADTASIMLQLNYFFPRESLYIGIVKDRFQKNFEYCWDRFIFTELMKDEVQIALLIALGEGNNWRDLDQWIDNNPDKLYKIYKISECLNSNSHENKFFRQRIVSLKLKEELNSSIVCSISRSSHVKQKL